MKYQGRSVSGLTLLTYARESHAVLGLVGIVDADGDAVDRDGFNGRSTSRVGMVADDKVEGDASLYVVEPDSCSQQQDSQSEKDRA